MRMQQTPISLSILLVDLARLLISAPGPLYILYDQYERQGALQDWDLLLHGQVCDCSGHQGEYSFVILHLPLGGVSMRAGIAMQRARCIDGCCC